MLSISMGDSLELVTRSRMACCWVGIVSADPEEISEVRGARNSVADFAMRHGCSPP